MTQKEFLSNLCKKNKNAVIVGSLGTISKDLESITHQNKVLVKGAMGYAMAVGLGYALGSRKKVIVVIGDGAFLMAMGSISTILYHNLKNLSIYILDNGKFASCGGQKTNFKYLWKFFPVGRIKRISIN